MNRIFVIRIVVLIGMVFMLNPVFASYRCPMHWELTNSDKPGKCPKCGMDLSNAEDDRPSDEMDGTNLESVEFDFAPLISTNSQTSKVNVQVSNNEALKTKGDDSTIKYKCRTHHDVISDKLGNCSICGRKLELLLNQSIKNRN